MRFGVKVGGGFFHEKTGFRIEETQLVSFPEDDALKKILVLPDEQAISQYLIKKSAERVAHYRYMESHAAKAWRASDQLFSHLPSIAEQVLDHSTRVDGNSHYH